MDVENLKECGKCLNLYPEEKMVMGEDGLLYCVDCADMMGVT